MYRAYFLLIMLPVSFANAVELVDPTRPSFLVNAIDSSEELNTQEEASLPKLQAIFSSMTGMSALLNGRRLKVGDQVSGYQVHEIERKAVTLMKNQETLTIKLSTASVKQRVGDDQ